MQSFFPKIRHVILIPWERVPSLLGLRGLALKGFVIYTRKNANKLGQLPARKEENQTPLCWIVPGDRILPLAPSVSFNSAMTLVILFSLNQFSSYSIVFNEKSIYSAITVAAFTLTFGVNGVWDRFCTVWVNLNRLTVVRADPRRWFEDDRDVVAPCRHHQRHEHWGARPESRGRRRRQEEDCRQGQLLKPCLHLTSEFAFVSNIQNGSMVTNDSFHKGRPCVWMYLNGPPWPLNEIKEWMNVSMSVC